MTSDTITGHVTEAKKGRGWGNSIEMECLCELKGVERGLISDENPSIGFVTIILPDSIVSYILAQLEVRDPRELKGVKIVIRLKKGFF